MALLVGQIQPRERGEALLRLPEHIRSDLLVLQHIAYLETAIQRHSDPAAVAERIGIEIAIGTGGIHGDVWMLTTTQFASDGAVIYYVWPAAYNPDEPVQRWMDIEVKGNIQSRREPMVIRNTM